MTHTTPTQIRSQKPCFHAVQPRVCELVKCNSPTGTRDMLLGCTSGGVIILAFVANTVLQLSKHPEGEQQEEEREHGEEDSTVAVEGAVQEIGAHMSGQEPDGRSEEGVGEDCDGNGQQEI